MLTENFFPASLLKIFRQPVEARLLTSTFAKITEKAQNIIIVLWHVFKFIKRQGAMDTMQIFGMFLLTVVILLSLFISSDIRKTNIRNAKLREKDGKK